MQTTYVIEAPQRPSTLFAILYKRGARRYAIAGESTREATERYAQQQLDYFDSYLSRCGVY
jgi:hypothetical protein